MLRELTARSACPRNQYVSRCVSDWHGFEVGACYAVCTSTAAGRGHRRSGWCLRGRVPTAKSTAEVAWSWPWKRRATCRQFGFWRSGEVTATATLPTTDAGEET